MARAQLASYWGEPERAPHWHWSIQPWCDGHVLKSLHNKHGKPHTVSDLFNLGMMPKVYVSSTEGLAPHVECS